MKKAVFLLALILNLHSSEAWAWWNGGHMRIAALAYERLTPAARAEVDRLIRLNPDYDTWTAHLPDPVKAKIAFVYASTWPDEIKHRTGYVHDTVGSATAARNIGYQDHIIHTYWHSVDLPFSYDHTPVVPPASPNALSQVNLFTATLASDASDSIRSYDLVWLIHLVGDIHQPLHTAARFSAALGDDDGGGAELVEPTRRDPIGLRLYWDSLLGDKPTAAEAIKAAEALPATDPALSDISDPTIWVVESFAIAQNHAYADFIADGRGPYRLTDRYENTALEISLQRAALAGVRLANLLNLAFHTAAR